jgi:hypothetical protein
MTTFVEGIGSVMDVFFRCRKSDDDGVSSIDDNGVEIINLVGTVCGDNNIGD